MTIEEFIEARLAEDERIASEANGGQPWHAIDLAEEGIAVYAGEDDGDPEAGYSYSAPRTGETQHITRHDPARAMRQAAALRKLVALTRNRVQAGWGDAAELFIVDELRPIAEIWAEHADFRQEWTPHLR